MSIQNLRKTVSISCSVEELELMMELRKKNIRTSDIFRRGLKEYAQENSLDITSQS